MTNEEKEQEAQRLPWQNNQPLVMDILKLVAKRTDTKPKDWEFIDGPDSRCGTDYWLEHTDGTQVYANDDQGFLSIEILDE